MLRTEVSRRGDRTIAAHAARVRRLAFVLAVALAFSLTAVPAQACSGSACYQSVSGFGKDPAFGSSVFRFPQAIAFSPGGAFVFVADQYSSVVQKFDSTGVYQNWLIGGYADKAQLRRFGVIGGLATDRNNHLYVLDSQNDRVQVHRSDTGRWLASFGSHGSAPGFFNLGANTGAGGIAVFQEPSAASPNPHPPIVYIADQDNHRVEKFTLTQTSSVDPTLGPVLPQGDRGSADATTDQYNVVAAPVPDTSWGSFGACNDTGQPACASSPSFNLALHFPQGITVNPVADPLGRHDVYIADDDNHRIVEYDPNGGYLNQVGTKGGGACQFRFPYDVGVDGNTAPQAIANTCGQPVNNPASNNLDVADNNNHRVAQYNAAALAFQRAWGAFGAEPGNFGFPRSLAALAENAKGGVYVTDTANNRIQGWFEVSGGVPTYLWGIAGRGPGYVTRPYGVALDPSGNLYVADTQDSRIQKFNSAGGFIGQYAYVSPNSGFAAPSSGQGAFNLPEGVAYDSRRNEIWVADTGNNRVQQLTATPSTINATDGTSSTFVAQHTGFSSPKGIAVDANGNVYVADTGNNRIQKFNGTGWSTVGGSTFNAPRGVAVDRQSGDLYVADSANNQVQRLASGSWSPVGGTTFSNPGGVFVDSARRLYVADTGNNQLQRVDLANTGAGWDRWGTDDITPGDFIGPASVTGDSNGNLFVTDTFNNRIQKFTVTMPTAMTPDFALSASPGLLTVVRGGAGASTSVAISPSNGFGSQVTLSVAGVPAGVTVSPIPPVTVSPDATRNYPPISFTFTASSTAKTGSATVTITGASGGLVRSTTVALQIKRR